MLILYISVVCILFENQTHTYTHVYIHTSTLRETYGRLKFLTMTMNNFDFHLNI